MNACLIFDYSAIILESPSNTLNSFLYWFGFGLNWLHGVIILFRRLIDGSIRIEIFSKLAHITMRNAIIKILDKLKPLLAKKAKA